MKIIKVRPRLPSIRKSNRPKVKPESRRLLTLRRNLWRIRNPDGGFKPIRFCTMPGRRQVGRRLLRTLDGYKPLEIGSYEGFRFIVSSDLEAA